MPVPWPAGVPANANSWQEQDADNLLRTQMDAGAGKVRRKWTGVVVEVNLTSIMTNAQWVRLREFYRVDCQQGGQTFTFTEPYTQKLYTYRWGAPPSISNLGPLAVQVSMKFEQIADHA